MIIGILAALTTLFSWSIGTFVFLNAARRIDPSLLNKARLMLAVIGSGALACVTTGMMPWTLVTGPTAQEWLWLGLSGLVGLSLGDYFGFTGLRILGARRQSIFGTIAPAAAMVAGFLMLSEEITVHGVIGMSMSIGGVMWSMASVHERTEVHREGYGSFVKGITFAILGAVCQGLGLVLAKRGLTDLTPFHATFMRMSIGFLVLFVTDVVRRAEGTSLADAFRDKVGVRNMMLGVVFGPLIGVTCSLIAAKHLAAAQAQTIFSLVPFVVMAITTVKHKERLRPQAIIGAVIATAGVILMSR